MTSSIREFWRGLDDSVHPDDAPYFKADRHSFNLEFPPPAFIGDIDNAPVVILMLNGGYDRTLTPAEFARPDDRAEYLAWIKGERKAFPQNLSAYYTQHPEFSLVRDGSAVIVNAVAYRSEGITREPQNQKLAKLPFSSFAPKVASTGGRACRKSRRQARRCTPLRPLEFQSRRIW
ncbi:hypothetical protein [Roseiarcus fermentans]|uniref:hypothetical protein n=1 Tax=Roseiarcus fermentans TaxID=1473586 RepID=UPI0011BD9E23|nr:hypothetical protein [Roseiarcus fermentans]